MGVEVKTTTCYMARAAAALAAWLDPLLERSYAAAALVVGALGYLTRLASLARDARLRYRQCGEYRQAQGGCAAFDPGHDLASGRR